MHRKDAKYRKVMNISLKVYNKENVVLCEANGENFVDLVCLHTYEEGDRIAVTLDEKEVFVKLQVDDALGMSMVYVTDYAFDYVIPFNEKRASMSPKIFAGDRHYLWVEKAKDFEIKGYRNLALNQNDQHREVPVYPHATANVETRGESVFAARNAIDGVRANLSHGEWPYESWGINRQDDATMKVDFGRKVIADRIVLYTRCDFPHDNWWIQATFTFSDGETLVAKLTKTTGPQEICFPEKVISWVQIGELIKADDPSPFPALTQMEIYGHEL